MHRREITFVGRAQALLPVDINPNTRAVFIGLIVVSIVFASGICAHYLW